MNQLDRWVAEFRSQELVGNSLSGYAAVFGQYAQVRGNLEAIEQRAFDRALDPKNPQDVALFLHHDPSLILARTSSGTLQLRADEKGLAFSAELPDTTAARDAKTLLARGDLRSMSFGFKPLKDKFTMVQGMTLRTITDLDLYEISVVSMPAYQGTSVSLRSLDEIALSQPGEFDLATQLVLIRHNLNRK